MFIKEIKAGIYATIAFLIGLPYPVAKDAWRVEFKNPLPREAGRCEEVK